jgi:hypothetical protein
MPKLTFIVVVVCTSASCSGLRLQLAADQSTPEIHFISPPPQTTVALPWQSAVASKPNTTATGMTTGVALLPRSAMAAGLSDGYSQQREEMWARIWMEVGKIDRDVVWQGLMDGLSLNLQPRASQLPVYWSPSSFALKLDDPMAEFSPMESPLMAFPGEEKLQYLGGLAPEAAHALHELATARN